MVIKPLLQEISELRSQIEEESDSETLELLEMDLADKVWLISNTEGEKPSDNWEEYKKEQQNVKAA